MSEMIKYFTLLAAPEWWDCNKRNIRFTCNPWDGDVILKVRVL